MKPSKLHVVTVTLNAEKYLPRLINSLQTQSDQDFTWVVVDGKSKDKTDQILKSVTGLELNYQSGVDFGIYDAMNKAVSKIDSGYYIVVGADDILYPDAIKNYRNCLNNKINIDFVATSLKRGNKIQSPKSGLGWLYGMAGVSSNHAVSLLINVDLHRKYGFYSNKFPIAADQLFVKKSLKCGAKIVRSTFIAGEFSLDGLSSADEVGTLTEFFRIQLLTEDWLLLQYILFFARLLRIYIKNSLQNIKLNS